MPKASEHQSGKFTKMLLVGESGCGKTGTLLSLLLAGFKVRVIDMDNGLDWLVNQLKKKHPEVLDNLEYVTCRDALKLGAGALGVVTKLAVPNAYPNAVKLMEKWEDGSIPSEWGHDYILVLDTLTFFANAAYRWKEALNPTVKDPRQIYGAAQDAVEDILELLTSAEFQTNVIVISHIRWVERQDGTKKAYPSAVGEALSPKIPTYFNNLLLSESSGNGANVKRTFKTLPTTFMDLKNTGAEDLPATLPINTGLADFFKAVQL